VFVGGGRVADYQRSAQSEIERETGMSRGRDQRAASREATVCSIHQRRLVGRLALQLCRLNVMYRPYIVHQGVNGLSAIIFDPMNWYSHSVTASEEVHMQTVAHFMATLLARLYGVVKPGSRL